MNYSALFLFTCINCLSAIHVQHTRAHNVDQNWYYDGSINNPLNAFHCPYLLKMDDSREFEDDVNSLKSGPCQLRKRRAYSLISLDCYCSYSNVSI